MQPRLGVEEPPASEARDRENMRAGGIGRQPLEPHPPRARPRLVHLGDRGSRTTGRRPATTPRRRARTDRPRRGRRARSRARAAGPRAARRGPFPPPCPRPCSARAVPRGRSRSSWRPRGGRGTPPSRGRRGVPAVSQNAGSPSATRAPSFCGSSARTASCTRCASATRSRADASSPRPVRASVRTSGWLSGSSATTAASASGSTKTTSIRSPAALTNRNWSPSGTVCSTMAAATGARTYCSIARRSGRAPSVGLKPLSMRNA